MNIFSNIFFLLIRMKLLISCRWRWWRKSKTKQKSWFFFFHSVMMESETYTAGQTDILYRPHKTKNSTRRMLSKHKTHIVFGHLAPFSQIYTVVRCNDSFTSTNEKSRIILCARSIFHTFQIFLRFGSFSPILVFRISVSVSISISLPSYTLSPYLRIIPLHLLRFPIRPTIGMVLISIDLAMVRYQGIYRMHLYSIRLIKCTFCRSECILLVVHLHEINEWTRREKQKKNGFYKTFRLLVFYMYRGGDRYRT